MSKDTLIKEFLFCLMLLSAIQCHVIDDPCPVEEFYNEDGVEQKKCYR
jgi:hypothetical protein